jgi:hypothetical protein
MNGLRGDETMEGPGGMLVLAFIFIILKPLFVGLYDGIKSLFKKKSDD